MLCKINIERTHKLYIKAGEWLFIDKDIKVVTKRTHICLFNFYFKKLNKV